MIYTNKAVADKPAVFRQITEKMAKTYEAKNHDYGDSFGNSMKEFGLTAAAVRMSDKIERIKSFAKMTPDQMKVKEESVQDTLLDLATYAVMTLIEMRAFE